MEKLTQIIEALIFASGKGISKQDIITSMPEITNKQLDVAISEIQEKYSGESGINLITYAGKYQFATNPAYGEKISEILLPLKEKELSKALLETLSIIAYKQPITRAEIEDVRGLNSEYSVQMLSKLNLIEVVGRKDAVGRPSLYATTDEFLKKFNLNTLDDLPEYSSLLDRIKIVEVVDESGTIGDSLYKTINVNEQGEFVSSSATEKIYNEPAETEEFEKSNLTVLDEFVKETDLTKEYGLDDEELPEFLLGEDLDVIE